MFSAGELSKFDREFLRSEQIVSCIGDGFTGGKASGLIFIDKILGERFRENPFSNIDISIPRMVVLTSGFFDRFIERNGIYDKLSGGELSDKKIALEFQKGDIPAEYVGDLRALVAEVHKPLAIRSSSMLEDTIREPFAGVYATKMIPNNQPDADSRFRKLTEAIKFVYASTFFRNARDYRRRIGKADADEKMAVIIQEIVGGRFGDRFYPHIAGVAKSYNFYSIGQARPEDGVVNLAFGLGKTIVDGGLVWSYSPAYPRVAPPVSSPRELLKKSQTKFWAVNMGQPPEYDPLKETEYMVCDDISEAEYDRSLEMVVSTYQAANDRLVTGAGSEGPRLVDFAPILKAELLPLNDMIRMLLDVCEASFDAEIEIEFALTINRRDKRAFLGFLQVRPMVVSKDRIEVTAAELAGESNLLASEQVLGNGVIDDIQDIIYVDPERFNARHNRSIASEIGELNGRMVDKNRPYLLIGFGRWGSSDSWLGIPVDYSQISGARAMVEATLPNMNVELSQGSHFFHNLSSFQIGYFLVRFDRPQTIDWDWLKSRTVEESLEFVRHIRLEKPVYIKIDGRSGRGIIRK